MKLINFVHKKEIRSSGQSMSGRKTITDDIVKKVAASAMTSNERVHVLPRSNKWVVRTDGAEKVSGIFLTKDRAILRAKQLVEKGKTIVVHNELGKITQRIK